MITLKKRLNSPEYIFIMLILVFGVISTFVTYPFSNGDEGYHLSKSYSIFSKNNPQSMSIDNLRKIESTNTSQENTIQKYGWKILIEKKLYDIEDDSISFNIQNEDNSTLKMDIGHIPSAIGTLIGRITYPSYGIMLIFSRLANLLFFSICLFFIIKSSQIGKWSLIMLFSIPFLQKIASPSYDVFSYVAVAAFSVNILGIIKQRKNFHLSYKRTIYTFLTILLILLAKNNYIFILIFLLFLPSVTDKIGRLYQKTTLLKKILFFLVLTILIASILKLTNDKFGLVNFVRQFFNSYVNVEMMGRRGRTLFNVVPTILPDMFNLFWILCLFIVLLTENEYEWKKYFVVSSSLIFLINWIGIYAGFYLILNKPTESFDLLSGRYLHPFIICFLPLAQRTSYLFKLTTNQKFLKKVSICSIALIMVSYLIICFYRGYVLHVTPTWSNR